MISKLLSVALLTITGNLGGCAEPEPTSDEVARVASPDKKVEAILIKKNVAATVSTPYEIYIVPVGEKFEGEPSFRGDKLEDLKLVWKEPRFLEIHYLKGRVFSFVNFWQSSKVENFTYVVELRLKPQNSGPSL